MKHRFTVVAAALLFATSLPLFAQNTTGEWSTTVQQDPADLEATVVAPLGKDKALNCNRHIIPVKFALATAEDVPLSSDTSDTDTTNDSASLTFDPTDTAMTVADLTNLTAVYDVVEGNCGGGSLRWSIDTTAGNVFIYYGNHPNFTDCSGAEGQSGVNLLSLTDARVDTSQVGGTFYDTWANLLATNPDLVVEEILLVSDGGWSQPDGVQSFNIESATVNDNTFTGEDLGCALPDATIHLTGANGEEISVSSAQGTGTAFREDDCQYIYNLVNPGPGTYTVAILVDGTVIGSSEFTVACKK